MMQRSWQSWRRGLTLGLVSRRSYVASVEGPPPPPEELDAFERDYLKQRIEITPFQRLLLGAGSSIASLLDPHR